MRAAGCLVLAVFLSAGCAREPGTTTASGTGPAAEAADPAWLVAAMTAPRHAGVSDRVVEEAAADPDHVARIRRAIRPMNDLEAYNLSKLVERLDIRNFRGDLSASPPEYLGLARFMYQADPGRFGRTLACIARYRPFDECEAEVLRIAFDPRAMGEGGMSWKSSREWAAMLLVQRLAIDVPMLPRALPEGAPAFTVDEDDRIACFHWTLCAAYAQGDVERAAANVTELLEGDRGPGNDHEAEDCRTVIWRITELGGKKP